ncbi:phage tail protein [Limosilactobacillus reuteri]|uniref:phage tail protein n=1 Tax=Limosilactobacillus reuteri TaxID=1598 RepID=UPI001E40B498|nr:phage tail protein [Limosilactobacillus reuteri]MCC4440009.1 phage tail protein [Limosilactobacillus reuteri]
MSISNPEEFDYLKVAEYDPTNTKNHYMNVYPLTSCVDRSSVHIKYNDNSDYNISFSVHDDGSAGFKALGNKARIIAGEQIFEISNFNTSVSGIDSSSVSADQLANVNFKRVNQPRKMVYTTSEGDKKKENVSYLTLKQLLNFFKHGIDMMGFKFVVHGWFPKRGIKDVGHWNGKQLLTKITDTWPGTVIIGWSHEIHFYGFQKTRGKNGELVNVRDIDTGQRFDNMYDTKDIKVERSITQMCNAIEVKSATYQVKNQTGGDDSDIVMQTRPYFANFLAVSEKSIKEYGYYMADSILDNNFTNKAAAIAAAREKMVTRPVVSVTATVDHPGKTEAQPIPGFKYTVGVSNDNQVYHVILRGFDWYPFNPLKGASLTLNSVDPGILGNLRTIVMHDLELSPTMTDFKELTNDDSDNDSEDSDDLSDDDLSDDLDDDGDDDDSDDDGDDDDGLDEVDTDDTTDRPDDDGNGDGTQPINGQQGSAQGFFLPISDRGTNAYISDHGNIVVNKNNNKWLLRVADDDAMAQLRDHKITPDSINQNHYVDRLMMIDYNHGSWMHGKHTNLNSNYQNADFYFSHAGLTGSGMWWTQAGQFTFRAKVANSDYNDDGTIHHVVDSYNDDGVGLYDDTKTNGKNPGHLARVNMGPLYATSTHKLSKLSTKQDVKPLDETKALNTIMDTDIATYRYKKEYDDKQNQEASVIIDDVHDKPQWKTPDIFKDKSGSYRNDAALLAYTVKAVQALSHKVDKLVEENKQLKKQLKNKS